MMKLLIILTRIQTSMVSQGGKMEIRLEKPALNNFKAYEWPNEKLDAGN